MFVENFTFSQALLSARIAGLFFVNRLHRFHGFFIFANG